MFEVTQFLAQAAQRTVSVLSSITHPECQWFTEQTILRLERVLRSGKRVLIAGNGGSLCDAMHFAEELSGRFQRNRPALPVLALADPALLSCIGNDMGFEQVFARGVDAFGSPGDLFIALSTSGCSANIWQALAMAKGKGLETVALLGRDGGVARGMADLEWVVAAQESARIQEVHMTLLHFIAEALETLLFGQEPAQNSIEAMGSL
jgi:D-sedoheptulose 7-phosphate isomerase